MADQGLPKVLIVEDDDRFLRLMVGGLGSKVEVFHAASLGEAGRLFNEHPDLALIVVDACVPGHEPNSMWLVKKMRETFKGPIVAASSSPTYRKLLMTAGCSYEAEEKGEVPQLITTILDLEQSAVG